MKYSEDLSDSRIASFRKKIADFNAINAWILLTCWVVIPTVLYGTYYLWDAENAAAFIGIAIAIGGALWFTLCGVHMYFMLQYAHANSYSGTNNDRKSVELTSRIIKESNKWLIFYDYGENAPKNIYSNIEIRDLLLEKLNGDQQFHISIIFDKPADSVRELSLVKELLEWRDTHKESLNKVFIIPNAASSSGKHAIYDTHYKINDTGYAYLTQHKEGDKRRNYTFHTPYAGRPIDDIDDCLDFHNLVMENNQLIGILR